MRARLVVNPAAGTDRAAALLPLINARLATLVRDLDITITTAAEDATRAAARAVAERADALFIAGGDGTVNAAMRGLASIDGGLRIPVGIIPLGTGNDFANALGLGADVKGALEALLAARVIDVDVGMLNDRPFVNTSAGGFVAAVSEAMNETLKDTVGKFAYLIAGARALVGTEAFSAALTVPGGQPPPPWPDDEELRMFAACNSPTIGGGYPIAPDAAIDDGLLDVVMVPRMPLLDFVGVLQQMAAGVHHGDQRVRRFRAPAFELRFSRRVRVNTDGELLHADRCAYSVRPRAACFFCGVRPRAAGAPRPLQAVIRS